MSNTPFLFVPTFSWPAAPFGLLYTYEAGSTTPKTTYSDNAGANPLTNPVELDATGSATIRLGAGTYKFVLLDQTNTVTLWTQDDYDPALQLSDVNEAYVAAFIWPPTAGEIATGVTLTTSYPYGDIRRYGVVANNSAVAAANSVSLQTLWNPSIAGPTGYFYFPNITGADNYYFSGVIPIRAGVSIDLQESTINYVGTGVAADSNSGLFFVLNDFECRNGTFTINFASGVASSAGNAIQIGARGTDSLRWPVAVWDSLLPIPIGNCRLTNLRINSNVTGAGANSAAAIALTGGIQGLVIEDVIITGNGTTPFGIVQEFGWATSNAQPSARQTSHMHNFVFKNIQITNIDTINAGSAGIVLAGAYQGTIENLSVTNCSNAVLSSTGESMFYRPWAGVDDISGQHAVTIRNVTFSGVTNAGLSLSGTQSRAAGSGYLQRAWVALTAYGINETVINGGNMYVATIGGTSAGSGGPTGTGTGISDGSVTWNYVSLTANTDQIDYYLEGIDGTGTNAAAGIVSSAGYLSLKGANFLGMANGLFFFAECTRFDIEGVRSFGAQNAGFEMATAAGAIWSPTRLKKGSIRDCYIYGNSIATTGNWAGININNCEGVVIDNNRINLDVNYNGVAETTQGCAIQAGSNAFGISARCNHVGNIVGGGNFAYFSGAATAALNANDIQNPLGVLTMTSNFSTNGTGNATTTNITSKTSNINTIGKLFGRLIVNSSNNRLMIATGPNNTDNWAYCDGNTPGTITPS